MEEVEEEGREVVIKIPYKAYEYSFHTNSERPNMDLKAG